jgi:hypothetical protein
MFLPLQGADSEGDSGDVLVWKLVSIMHVLVFILVLEELTQNSLPSKRNNTVKINIDLLLFSCLWTFQNPGLSFFFFTDMYAVGYCDRERSLVQLVTVRTQMYGNVYLKLWA